jgi:hypothetical protein
VPEVSIRNPVARWTLWLVVGIGLTLALALILADLGKDPCIDDSGHPCKVPGTVFAGAFLSPLPLGFLLAAYFSYRARTTITEQGIQVRAFMENKLYRWSDIRRVTNVVERRYANGVRMGTERRIQVELTNGKLRELPTPRAGLLVGKQEYQTNADLIYQAWLARRQTQ